MTLPISTISMSEVNVELTRPATQIIELNDAEVRTVAGVGGSGTVISMNDLRGKSFKLFLTISSSTSNYNLYNAAVAAGWSGNQGLEVTIDSGVVVSGSSPTVYAFSVPTGLAPASSITIINNGTIAGKGGNGGDGGYISPDPNIHNGKPGTGGGDALYVARPVVMINNGAIRGGGGGGGGGGSAIPTSALPGSFSAWYFGGGGGGGAGFGGIGGAGGLTSGGPAPAQPGQNGTLSAGGSGGLSRTRPGVLSSDCAGGAGGGNGASGSAGLRLYPSPRYNSSGGAGGSGGRYLVGAPFVTWNTVGTVAGPAI